MSKKLTDVDKQTIYCLDEFIKSVNLLSARGYPGKAIAQALMTTLARFINLQQDPLATLTVCVRAVGACVIADLRAKGCVIDEAAVREAFVVAADANVEVVHLDDELLKQVGAASGGDGKKSN